MENQYQNTQNLSTNVTPNQQGTGGPLPSSVFTPQIASNQQVITPPEAPVLPEASSLEQSPTSSSQSPVVQPVNNVSTPSNLENRPQPQPNLETPRTGISKKLLIIGGIALVIVLIIILLIGLISKKNGAKLQSPAESVSEQGITLGSNTTDTLNVLQLKGSHDKLIVNGDVISTGRLTMASGNYFGQFVTNNLSQNREYLLPDASGTICLDVNNCNFAKAGAVVSTINGSNGTVSIQGTANQISVSSSGGTVTLSTPQDIATTSSPTFASINISGDTTVINNIAYTWPASQINGVLVNNGSGGLTWSAIAAACPTCFVNGGNSFGGNATLGTNDNFSLALETNGASHVFLDTTGNVGISSVSNGAKLYVPYQTGDAGGPNEAGSIAGPANALLVVGSLNNTNNNLIAISGESYSGVGVQGASQTGSGVVGESTGTGGIAAGVLGVNFQSGGYGVVGLGGLFGGGNAIGVAGYSDNATGVFGQSSAGISGLFQSSCTGLFGCSTGPSALPTLVTRQYGASTTDLFQAQDSANNARFAIGYNGHTGIGNGNNAAIDDCTLLSSLLSGATCSSVVNVQENITDFSKGYTSGINNQIQLSAGNGANVTSTVQAFANSIVTAADTANYNIVRGDATSIVHQGSGNITFGEAAHFAINNLNAGSISFAKGLQSDASNTGSGSIAFASGVDGNAYNTSNGTIGQAVGVNASAGNLGSGTVTTAIGLDVKTGAAGVGAVTNNYGIQIESPFNVGAISNNYGLYIQDQSGVGSLNSYNLYSAGAGANYFGGNIVATTLGTADTSTYLCRNSTNQIATCNTTGAGAAFVQGGNSFGAAGTLGTNDNNPLNIRANGLDVLTLQTDGTLTVQTNTVNFGYNGNINAPGDGAQLTLRADSGINIVSGSNAGGAVVISSIYDAQVLAVKGFAGQTLDLQQWQNNSGKLLSAIDSSGRLQFADGVGGAKDTNLYRGAAGQLNTDGDLKVGSQVAVGSVASITSNTIATFGELYTANSGSLYGTSTAITLNPAGASSANATASFNNIAITGQNHTGFLTGNSSSVTNNGSGTLTYAFGSSAGAVNTSNGIISIAYGTTGAVVNSGAGSINFLGAGVVGQLQNTGLGTIASGTALFAASATNSGGGSITSNTGLYVQAQTAGVSDYGIQVEAADTQTLWLSSNADNTTANAGIAFGSSRDTNLYRGAATQLNTDGDLKVGSQLAVGSTASITTNTTLSIAETSTATSGSIYGSNNVLNYNPSGATTAVVYGGVNQVTTPAGNAQNISAIVGSHSRVDHSGTGTISSVYGQYGYVAGVGGSGAITTAIGSIGQVDNFSSSTYTQTAGLYGIAKNGAGGSITTAYGVFGNVANGSTGSIGSAYNFSSLLQNVNAAGTITTAAGFYAQNPSNAGTITTNYGILVDPQTAGVSDYGVAIGAADTQTLWVSSNANNTTASAGIAFGSSRDTNLYRSAAATLATDATTFSLNGASGTINTTGTNAALTVQSNGSGVLTLDSGTTGNVNLGTGANAKTVTIGNATGATDVNVNLGSGVFNVTNTAADANTVAQFNNAGATNCTVQPGGTGFACSSDARLKTNVATIIDPLDTIRALRGVHFNWISNPSGQTQSGFIAQELMQVIPEAVSTAPDGTLVANYSTVVPYLVGTAQVQDLQITGLQQGQINLQQTQSNSSGSIANLTSRVDNLDQRVSTLEANQGNTNFASLNVSGPATIQTLTVTGSATIANLTVTGNATIAGNLTIQGHVLGNSDTRGSAVIPAGQTQIKYSFTRPYTSKPFVVVSPINKATQYTLDITKDDFTITIPNPDSQDIEFNYMVQE